MKEIFEYLDYRAFLSDFFAEQTRQKTHFSYRYASQRVGMDASNIHKIIQGKRHITDSTYDGFVRLLNLSGSREKFFRLMIQFGKSRATKKRKEYFQQMLSFNKITANTVASSQYEFYQKWYNTAVLALLHVFPLKEGDWDSFAKMLQPAITPEQVEEAINLLLRLNFIVKTANNGFKHTGTIITTGEQWFNIAVDTFQKETLELALRSLKEDPIKDRYVSTLTITLSDESYTKMKEVTAQYRKDVLKIVQECDDSNRVYQLNLQLFPLSQEVPHA